MTITVTGSHVSDIASQIGRGGNTASIEIWPRLENDFGRITELGFRVRVNHQREPFTKEVSSMEELFSTIRQFLQELQARARRKIKEEKKRISKKA